MIRLLLPVDGSENAARAVQAVADWHRRLAPIEVRLLFVRVSDSVPPASLGQLERDDAVGRGQRALESAEALLARVGVPCTREMRDGYVPSVIVQCANSMSCDCIVMGTRGMGSAVQTLGSIARQVVNLADIPVTLVK
jgi:nucleotide-binding universal stress UspA family protein